MSTGRWRQSAAMQALAEAAGPGGFAVPCCPACKHRFYPPQSWCPRCLSDGTRCEADSGEATVLSMTALRMSFDAAWKDVLPVYVACVRTASGVSLFAMARQPLATGARVRITLAAATGALPALLHVEPWT